MKLIGYLTVSAALAAVSLSAAPRYNYGYDQSVALQEMRDSIEDVRHELRNHESEIRTFEDKLQSQETIIDGLREQMAHSSQSHLDQLKGNAATLEMKINSLDTATKGLAADLKQLKNHANESSAALLQSKQKVAQLEKIIEAQNQNLDNLQAALKALMDALDVKAPGTVAASGESSGKVYRVKSGDSLEKIAKAHQTSTKAIKELNGLSHDKIVVGQTLKIP